MLEKPDLADDVLIAGLHRAYSLENTAVTFLPLGYDVDTAVYQAIAGDGAAYFVKLRRGAFAQQSILIPHALSQAGIGHLIAPLPTASGELWAVLPPFTVTVYPFVAGRNGFDAPLTTQHWRDLGSTLRHIHAATLPADLLALVPSETYTPRWREQVMAFLERAEHDTFADPVAQQTAALLRGRRAEIKALVQRTEELAQDMHHLASSWCVCHGDMHAGNLLIDQNDQVYLVDWDTLICAPRERDLMFIGGAQGFRGHTPDEEEALFYAGYGQIEINAARLAYYRYERVIQDIASFGEALLLSTEGGEDRLQSLRFLAANFAPGSTLVRARAADRPNDRST